MMESEAEGPPHYAKAFAPERSGCFRLIANLITKQPMHCLEPPAWTGTFRDTRGRRYRVRACEAHHRGLETPRRWVLKG